MRKRSLLSRCPTCIYRDYFGSRFIRNVGTQYAAPHPKVKSYSSGYLLDVPCIVYFQYRDWSVHRELLAVLEPTVQAFRTHTESYDEPDMGQLQNVDWKIL